nr:MAG TPA: hypothetical protein [Bacteriophage sp.]
MISTTEKISKNNLRAYSPIETAKVKAQHCSKKLILPFFIS